MADSPAFQSTTPATLPAGFRPATDSIVDPTINGGSGAVDFQYIKIADGTPDSANKAIVDSSGRLYIAALELPLNAVSSPVMSVAGAYASGDYVGPTTTPASFATINRASGLAIVVDTLVVTDKTTNQANLEIWFFDRTFTAPTDNQPWTLSAADRLNCIAVQSIAAWTADAAGAVHTVTGLGLRLTPNGTSLFYAVVSRSAKTWTSLDLQIRLQGKLD